MAGYKARMKRFEKLVSDCKSILRKKKYKNLKYAHILGKRIATDPLYKWNKRGNGQLFRDLSAKLGLNEQTLRQYVRFAIKFPNFEDFIRAHQVIAKQGELTLTYVRENLLYDEDEVEEPLELAIHKAVKGKKRQRFVIRTIKKLKLIDYEALKFLMNIKEREDFKGMRLKYFQVAVEELALRIQEEKRYKDYFLQKLEGQKALILKAFFENMGSEDWTTYFPWLTYYDQNKGDWVVNIPRDINEFVDLLIFDIALPSCLRSRENVRLGSTGCGLRLPEREVR